MQKYANTVTDTLGNVVSLASVSVYTDAGHTTLATVYSDNGITPTTNPRTTDSLGNFSFYAADGRYYIKVTKTGVTTQFLDDVILFDPTASTSAASINTVQSGSAPLYGWATRTVQGKESDLISIKDVLCADGQAVQGNGVHDDTTGLNAASLLSFEKSVPSGTYLVNSPLTLSGTWRIAQGAKLKPASGVTITLGSTAVIFTANDTWLDTSAGGTYAATAGSHLRVIAPPNAGQTPNVLNGFGGNTIGSSGACVIAGGGNASNVNSIGSSCDYSNISGGYDNQIASNNLNCTIAGGSHHRVSALHGTIGGGAQNTASGDTCVIAGGDSNTASGQESAILGGTTNTASAIASTVCGGSTNAASAQNAFVGGGTANTAAATNSVIGGGTTNAIGANSSGATIGGGGSNNISPGTSGWGNFTTVAGGSTNLIGNSTSATCANSTIGGGSANSINNALSGTVTGGQNNQVNADCAQAGGSDAVANFKGGNVWASGKFATSGDAQFQDIPLRITTTNSATFTNLLAGPSANAAVVVPNDTTWLFSALVVARRTDADNESAAYRIDGSVDNNAGTVALVGAITTTVINEDTAAWDARVVTSGTQLNVQVAGELAKTINWFCRLTLVQVTG